MIIVHWVNCGRKNISASYRPIYWKHCLSDWKCTDSGVIATWWVFVASIGWYGSGKHMVPVSNAATYHTMRETIELVQKFDRVISHNNDQNCPSKSTCAIFLRERQKEIVYICQQTNNSWVFKKKIQRIDEVEPPLCENFVKTVCQQSREIFLGYYVLYLIIMYVLTLY